MRSLLIRVTRDQPLADRTLGVVELDLPDDTAGLLPFGFSLEDPQEQIPAGLYPVHLYNSPKHGPDTPELTVPGRRHIQIHSGNGPEDTLGCLLFGLGRDASRVLRSRVACTWLRALIAEVLHAGGTVTVEVRPAP